MQALSRQWLEMSHVLPIRLSVMHMAVTRALICLQEDKVAEAERELLEATNRTEAAKKVYETIIHRMSQELSRFQKERALETSHILHSFAVAQVSHLKD